MNIRIRSVPPHFIRAEQCGDWNYDSESIQVFVRNDIPPDSQFAVAIHEAVEAWRCRRDRITDDAVVEFDQQYEQERKEGKHKEDDEPGDDPRAPYREQHQAATHVEMAVCAGLGITWKEHSLSVLESEAVPRKNESHGLRLV